MKKITYLSFFAGLCGFFVSIFFALEVTTVFFNYGLPVFLTLFIILAITNYYFNYLDIKNTFNMLKEKINTLVGKRIKISELILLIVSSGLVVVPIFFQYVNYLVYSYSFFSDLISSESDYLLVLLQTILIPLIIIVSLNSLKSIYTALHFLVNLEYKKPSQLKITNIIIGFGSLCLGGYMAYNVTQLVDVGMQLYKITFSDDSIVYQVPLFLNILLFTAAFISFSFSIYRFFTYMQEVINTRKLPSKEFFYSLVAFVLQLGVSTYSAEKKLLAAFLVTTGNFFPNQRNIIGNINNERKKLTK